MHSSPPPRLPPFPLLSLPSGNCLSFCAPKQIGIFNCCLPTSDPPHPRHLFSFLLPAAPSSRSPARLGMGELLWAQPAAALLLLSVIFMLIKIIWVFFWRGGCVGWCWMEFGGCGGVMRSAPLRFCSFEGDVGREKGGKNWGIIQRPFSQAFPRNPEAPSRRLGISQAAF